MRWSRTEEAGPRKISQPLGMHGYIICHLDIGYAYIFRRRQTDRYIGGLMKGGGGVVSPRMAGNAGDSHLPAPELKSLRWVDRTAPRRAWSVALVTRSYLVLGERGVLPRLRITPRQGFCGEKPIWKRKATRIELTVSRAVKFFKCSSGLTSFSSIREVVLFTFSPLWCTSSLQCYLDMLCIEVTVVTLNHCPKSLAYLTEILKERAAIYWWEVPPGGPDLHTWWRPCFSLWSGQ